MTILDRADLRGALNASWTSRIILTAVELDIFTHVKSGPATAADVASMAKTDTRATEILMDALVAIGLLHKEGDSFTNSPLAARHLVSDAPHSLTSWVAHLSNLWERWSHLTDVVRTGRPASASHTPNSFGSFIRAMHDSKRDLPIEDVLPIKLRGVKTAVDLGGGPGTLAMLLARALPDAVITLVDRPEALLVAEELVPADFWGTRVLPKPGDLTTGDPIGEGYDLAVLSAVLHAYGPETCREMVRRAAAALAPGGRLVIREQVLDESRTQPPGAAIFSVNMLVNTPEGRSYAFYELEGWMKEAGLHHIHRRPVERGDAVVGHR